MLTRTLGPNGGWIVRSHIGWRGERSIFYKGVETSPYKTCFKNIEGKPERKNPKKTTSISSELGRLIDEKGRYIIRVFRCTEYNDTEMHLHVSINLQ